MATYEYECKKCKFWIPWYGTKSGYCKEIFKHLGLSEEEAEQLVYAEMVETFKCGAFERS